MSSFWIKATNEVFKNVTIKNPKDWKTEELRLLYNGLSKVLAAFGGNTKVFGAVFGNIMFEKVPDGTLGGAGARTNVNAGIIQIESYALSKTMGDVYGAPEWAVVHEMGHIFDMKWANSDPHKYYSNLFVELLNGGCKYLGVYGCLGSNPPPGEAVRYLYGQDIGNYHPANMQTTGYGYTAGSTEDFAESFAGTILGNPTGLIAPKREMIIQTLINLSVSYFQ